VPPPTIGAPLAAPSLRPSRPAIADKAFRALSLGAGLLVLVILALIAFATIQRALPVFRSEGIGFVTSTDWSPQEGRFGSLKFVYGTLVISAVALVFAVPTSVGIALFLSEVAPNRLRKVTVLFVDLLASVPSVVFGLFGFLYLSQRLKPAMGATHDVLGGLPLVGRLFGEPSGDGRSFFVAGLILALMITPIITSISREVFETTPPGQKEAALALGSTRWEMIRGAVFPHARSGVIGAVMLGLGRAMGETIAAALVIGSFLPAVRANLLGTGDAMAAVIVNDFPEAGTLHKSALIGLGVVLFGMTILVNLVARMVVERGRVQA
jgi:phosphate transport system permease protein